MPDPAPVIAATRPSNSFTSAPDLVVSSPAPWRYRQYLRWPAPGANQRQAPAGSYLDTVADLGPILGAVTAPGSPSARLAEGDQRIGPRFVARVLIDHFALPEERARAVAIAVLRALID